MGKLLTAAAEGAAAAAAGDDAMGDVDSEAEGKRAVLLDLALALAPSLDAAAAAFLLKAAQPFLADPAGGVQKRAYKVIQQQGMAAWRHTRSARRNLRCCKLAADGASLQQMVQACSGFEATRPGLVPGTGWTAHDGMVLGELQYAAAAAAAAWLHHCWRGPVASSRPCSMDTAACHRGAAARAELNKSGTA